MADPGFPIGAPAPIGEGAGRRCPTWVLFSKNVCKNERIGSHPPPGSASGKLYQNEHLAQKIRREKETYLSDQLQNNNRIELIFVTNTVRDTVASPDDHFVTRCTSHINKYILHHHVIK